MVKDNNFVTGVNKVATYVFVGTVVSETTCLSDTITDDPPIDRNLPPIAGRINWNRQLFRRIEAPIRIFQQKPGVLQVTSPSLKLTV